MPDGGGATVVIGLGNPIMGDDGFGLAALDALRALWAPTAEVEFVDGGTWGLSLLPVVERAERLLLLDAIECGGTPGTVVRLRDDEIPSYLMTKVSPHQVDMREVLALAALRGRAPAEVVAIGAQPAVVELVGTLSPEVAAAVEAVAVAAVGQLEAWASRDR
ncbi:MAG: hypothetical protein ABS52_11750 [Gemmatimonadetes bacterium SCN 70-22]|nr:MAG: hypothetical protein ABS52_11750 [Gemmatimonadetes bacterium SCN 70-22]